jgi:predicted small secreted protein
MKKTARPHRTVAGLCAGGCNTVKGVGQDMKRAEGHAIERAAK